MTINIAIPYDDIADFCERHHIRKLSLFGSVITDHFRPDSDIDVLVEFEDGHTPTFFRFVDMQDELAVIFGREVDLHTPKSLSKYFQQEVLQLSQVIYDRS
jgi:hypothetical protein